MKTLALFQTIGMLLLVGCIASPEPTPTATNAASDGAVTVATANQSRDSGPGKPGPAIITDESPPEPAASRSAAEAVGVEPTAGPGPTAENLSGQLALFYRASFGANTESLRWTHQGDPGDALVLGGNITWETGSKGIVRLIPATGQVDLLKVISSPSWSRSSFYPLTYGGRLFAIRDWGADWTVENKRFEIEELDPLTGASRSSASVTAEWLTVVGDQLYFQREVTRDFWGSGRTTGGQTMAARLGEAGDTELPLSDTRLHAVGDRLVSWSGNELQQHDPATGRVVSSTTIAPSLREGVWPSADAIFYGDDAVYWARETGEPNSPNSIEVIRAPLAGSPQALITFDLEGFEQGLVIDESQGKVVVGVTGSAPPNGLAVLQVFLIDRRSGSIEELSLDQSIPASIMEAGGGLQALVLPPAGKRQD